MCVCVCVIVPMLPDILKRNFVILSTEKWKFSLRKFVWFEKKGKISSYRYICEFKEKVILTKVPGKETVLKALKIWISSSFYEFLNFKSGNTVACVSLIIHLSTSFARLLLVVVLVRCLVLYSRISWLFHSRCVACGRVVCSSTRASNSSVICVPILYEIERVVFLFCSWRSEWSQSGR